MKRLILSPYFPGVVLFIIALVIGLTIYKDYGVAWDEPIHRGVGRITYQYVFEGNPTLKTYEDRALGTGFELPLIFLEKWLNITDIRDIYLARHLATHLFFLLSVFCGYVLAYRLFQDRVIASLAFMLLAFHPRIYAHSFFNSKDIPFLSAFLIAMLLCQLAFEKNRPVWYLLLGLACGYATSIRAMGILLVPCLSLFFLLDFIRAISLKDKASTVGVNFLLFIVGFCALLYIAWPILWSSPVFYFKEQFNTLAHISWTGNVLFNGKVFSGDHLPWNYLPVWFSITMPELWLIAGLTGFIWLITAFIKNPKRYLSRLPERNFLLFIACFAGPVIAVVGLNAVNYDDWRHLYFIYPSFVMLALFAVSKLARGRRKVMIWSACVLQVILSLGFIVKAHPFEQVYFNHFVSHDEQYLRKNYDLEYWGCGFKQALEHLINTDNRPVIKICSNDAGVFPLNNNIQILPPQFRSRIEISEEPEKSDYFISNFRLHPDDYAYPKTMYSVSVLNSNILQIYKMH